jgi:hypothetical protein
MFRQRRLREMHLSGGTAETALLGEVNEGLELLHRQVLKTVGSHTPFLLLKISRAPPPVSRNAFLA